MGDNRKEGEDCYSAGNDEIRQWMRIQWKIWPRRLHPDRTTNLNFMYGGITAYRKETGADPVMSRDLASNIKYLDRALAAQHEGEGDA